MLVALQIGSFAQAVEKEPLKIIAYYAGNGTDISKYEINKVQVINYCFAVLSGDTIDIPGQEKKEGLRLVTQLKLKDPDLKILISFGGWGGCKDCSMAFSTDAGRLRFAQSVVSLLDTYNADGIDLDWEYPVIPGPPEHGFAATDKANFTALLSTLRLQMGNKRYLTFAAGGFTDYLEKSIDWKAIAPLVDFVNLMTYDLVHGYSKTTGHHSPLFSTKVQEESTAHCVEYLLQHGFPAQKLIVGIPFYGRLFENVPKGNPQQPGLTQPAKFKNYIAYNDYNRQLSPKNGWKYAFDSVAKADYAYNPKLKQFATFETKKSLVAKMKFAKKHHLGGVMFWELTNDFPTNGLLNEMYQNR